MRSERCARARRVARRHFQLARSSRVEACSDEGEGAARGTILIAGSPAPPAPTHRPPPTRPTAYRVVAHSPHFGIAAIPNGISAAHVQPSTAAGSNRAARISATLGSQVRANVVPPSAKLRVEPNPVTAGATRAPSPAPAPAALPRIGSLPRSPSSARSRRFSDPRARASRSPDDPSAHSVVSPARRSASTSTRTSNGAPAARARTATPHIGSLRISRVWPPHAAYRVVARTSGFAPPGAAYRVVAPTACSPPDGRSARQDLIERRPRSHADVTADEHRGVVRHSRDAVCSEHMIAMGA